MRHHLDSVTSPYSQVYRLEYNMGNGFFWIWSINHRIQVQSFAPMLVLKGCYQFVCFLLHLYSFFVAATPLNYVYADRELLILLPQKSAHLNYCHKIPRTFFSNVSSIIRFSPTKLEIPPHPLHFPMFFAGACISPFSLFHFVTLTLINSESILLVLVILYFNNIFPLFNKRQYMNQSKQLT